MMTGFESSEAERGPEGLALTLFEAFATKDPEFISSYFAEDAKMEIYGDPKFPSSYRGRAAIKQVFVHLYKSLPNLATRVEYVLTTGKMCAVGWAGEGAEPDGQVHDSHGITVLEVENGKIQRFREYIHSVTH